MVAANREYSPSATRKPAKSIVASLGTGMHALSSSIRRNTPGSPSASTTSTARSTIGSVSEAIGNDKRRGRLPGLPVPLFASSLDEYQPRIAEKLAEVARSGRYILGPEVAGFEDAFASYLGVRHCIGVANGTDALTIA